MITTTDPTLNRRGQGNGGSRHHHLRDSNHQEHYCTFYVFLLLPTSPEIGQLSHITLFISLLYCRG